MRRLHTARLALEPQVAAHAAAMFAVLSDPAIYEYENAPPASVEALRARYAFLEARHSPDGVQQWLNWVARLRRDEKRVAQLDGPLIGYVQATLHADGHAGIAYEFASAFWHRGLATEAVQAMIDELVAWHGVQRLAAVLKARNERSRRLLERLGFRPADGEHGSAAQVGTDELLMQRDATVTPRRTGSA